MKIFLLSCILLLNQQFAYPQFHTFQKSYAHTGHMQSFGVTQTPDLGYAFTSLVNDPSVEIGLTKTDCKGNVEWTKTFGASGSPGNTFSTVIAHSSGDLIMINNIGSFFANTMDIIVVRITLEGTVVWIKKFGSIRNDSGRGIIETNDGNLVAVGSTASMGSDVFSTSYRDMLMFKIEAGTGELIWSQSFGNAGAIDDGYGIMEDRNDGSLVMTGRYLTGGFFYTAVVKTNSDGELTWIKSYGVDGFSTYGYGIIHSADDKYVLCGSTTQLGVDWTSYHDPYLIKLEPSTGDTVWTKIFPPSDDRSDSASGLVEDEDGNYAIAVPTMSYSSLTEGYVPNKHALLRVDSDGNLFDAKIYNTGGSHYCRIQKSVFDDSYIMSGFSNQDWANFEPLLIKMDNNFNSGCNETNVLSLTNELSVGFNIVTPPYETDDGLNVGSATETGSFTYTEIRTLCESIPEIHADFSFEIGCAGSLTTFNSTSFTDGQTVKTWDWNFGDGNTSTLENPMNNYSAIGTYIVQLIVSDGCSSDTISKTVEILSSLSITVSDDKTISAGESTDIWADGASSYLWSPPDGLSCTDCDSPTASPSVTTLYYVIGVDISGCLTKDSVLVTVEEMSVEIGELFIPNVFSPNKDNHNDILFVRGGPFTEFKFMVFDRWGEIVFQSENQTQGWDGTFKGRELNSGVFIYIFEAEYADGTKVTKKGNITLIR